jgi:hypothetical protein
MIMAFGSFATEFAEKKHWTVPARRSGHAAYSYDQPPAEHLPDESDLRLESPTSVRLRQHLTC